MKSRSGFIVTVTIVTILVSLLVSVPTTVQAKKAAQQVSPVILYDANKNQLPEGLTFDKIGNMYVSISTLNEVWKIRPDGSEKLLLIVPNGGQAFGLAVDDSGNVYASFAFNPDTRGVYRIDHKSGTAQRLPGTENILWANGLCFDERGNLYVTDSLTGAIWIITPHGSAKIWFEDEMLTGLGTIPNFGLPVGANGIAYYHGSIYVASTERAYLIRVPIKKGGAAGKPVVVADGDELYGLDGIALDVHGNIYGALVLKNELVKIDHNSMKITVLATANDGLDNPASPAFGTGKCNQQTLFFTNFSLGLTGAHFGYGPAVLKIGVGTPGLPLP
jgi:sugar lactone lactonase YvrE